MGSLTQTPWPTIWFRPTAANPTEAGRTEAREARLQRDAAEAGSSGIGSTTLPLVLVLEVDRASIGQIRVIDGAPVPLAEREVRLRIDRFAITANNITYAVFGDALAYWEFFPTDLPWVLRIDGHTDRRPISTRQFPSNWELSAARAINVGKFLIDDGVPPERIAVAGFADFQPLDDRRDEIAYRRNRRIEIKLTTR